MDPEWSKTCEETVLLGVRENLLERSEQASGGDGVWGEFDKRTQRRHLTNIYRRTDRFSF